MSDKQKTKKGKNSAAKATFWGSIAFYLLIVFELVYMAGPFAAYFYSVYNPALNFFNSIPILSWLTEFFMPHVVRETKSMFLNIHEIIGAILAIGGFLFFLIGACKIYYSKFAKKGAVTGGIYKYIRHPQYISFIVCSFGMMLVWPRFLVLVALVLEIFIYYFLALAEERECETKFGQSYIDYKNSTGMFFPKLSHREKKRILPASGLKRAAAITCIFIVTMGVSIGLGFALQTYSVNSLYAIYFEDSVSISLSKMSDEKIETVMQLVHSDPQVLRLLETEQGEKQINYILPTEWYAAEIPMNGVVYRRGHLSPSDYNPNLYKVILLDAQPIEGTNPTYQKLVTALVYRKPIAEVWVDLTTNQVTQVLEIPENTVYTGIPVAVY